MKKTVFVVGAMLLSIFILTGCGSQQADLSGIYCYVQNNYILSDSSGNSNILHRITITRLDKTNKKYKLVETGMYGNGNNEGTLTVDGDIVNTDLPESSWNLDKELDNFLRGGVDISNAEGVRFTFKDGVLSMGENNKIEFYKEDTKKGAKYQDIFLGNKLWNQVFDTPAPDNSQSRAGDNEESTKSSEVEGSKDVTFSNVKYNPTDGTMSLKVKNNTDSFIDSATIYGTIQEHTTNGYGEDEVTEKEFKSFAASSSDLSNNDLTAIDDGAKYVINHIDKGEAKEFKFHLNVGDDPSIYSDPKIDGNQTKIVYRGETINDNDWYQSLDSDYELKTNTNADGEIESVTITNKSDYQWEIVEIHHEYAQRFGDKLRYSNAFHKQVDIGATVTIENLGGTTPNYGHATRIMYVAFQPRKK